MIRTVVLCDVKGCGQRSPVGVGASGAIAAARRHGWRCERATDLCPAHAVPPLDEAVR